MRAHAVAHARLDGRRARGAINARALDVFARSRAPSRGARADVSSSPGSGNDRGERRLVSLWVNCLAVRIEGGQLGVWTSV